MCNQVGVALKEITNQRLLLELQEKLKNALKSLREGIGDTEVNARKERVHYLKSRIIHAKKELQKAKDETIFVPIKK